MNDLSYTRIVFNSITSGLSNAVSDASWRRLDNFDTVMSTIFKSRIYLAKNAYQVAYSRHVFLRIRFIL